MRKWKVQYRVDGQLTEEVVTCQNLSDVKHLLEKRYPGCRIDITRTEEVR